MTIRKKLAWIPIIPFLIYFGCAKQTSPTGGPKDTIPPRLITSVPNAEAVNFSGKKIDLNFSELVLLNNPKEQLLITPAVGKNYEITVKKKTVTIEFEKELQPNTTYTLNFRDAIQDITEKNPIKNFQFALSTGAYIDSLSISGKITDLLRGTRAADATVAIAPHNDTFNILRHPATIFTRTDKEGNYRIDHLKPGNYFIYAIADKNKNLFADTRTESYGFRKDSLILTRDTSKIDFGLLRLDARPLRVTSARPYNTYFNIRTTKNIREYKLTSVDGSPLVYSFAENQANVKLFDTIGEKDSIAFNFTAMDSIANYLDTLLYAKFSRREAEPEKFQMEVKPGLLITDKGTLDATLTFTKPVAKILYDSIYFEVDSLTRVSFQKEDFQWDQITNKLTIRKRFDRNLYPKLPDPELKSPDPANTTKKMRNRLVFGKAAFISIEADSTKKTNADFAQSNSETLSKILYEFRTTETLLIQLLDRNYNVAQEIYNKPKGQFENLQAGEYMVRVIIDRNKNQTWDTGSYYKREEPEKIIYYIEPEKKSEKITLKSNWEFVLAPMLITY
jgi:uncharacterized protein (DUF2141 family)